MIERGIAGLPQKRGADVAQDLLLPTGGYWVGLLRSTNSAAVWAKNVERMTPVLLGPQLIDELAFRVTNTPDAGAIVRLGVREDVSGHPGKPVIDVPVTVTAAAWNSVVVKHYHPGGLFWASLTTQNWTTTGPSLDQDGAGPAAPALAISAALTTLGWNAGHAATTWAQTIPADEPLPAKFVNTQASNLSGPVIAAKRGD